MHTPQIQSAVQLIHSLHMRSPAVYNFPLSVHIRFVVGEKVGSSLVCCTQQQCGFPQSSTFSIEKNKKRSDDTVMHD